MVDPLVARPGKVPERRDRLLNIDDARWSVDQNIGMSMVQNRYASRPGHTKPHLGHASRDMVAPLGQLPQQHPSHVQIIGDRYSFIAPDPQSCAPSAMNRGLIGESVPSR